MPSDAPDEIAVFSLCIADRHPVDALRLRGTSLDDVHTFSQLYALPVVAEVFTADPAHVASTHPAAEVASTAGRRRKTAKSQQLRPNHLQPDDLSPRSAKPNYPLGKERPACGRLAGAGAGPARR